MSDAEEVLAELRSFRKEARAEFRHLNARMDTLEFGVLSIAQRLLADSEVQDIRERMRDQAPA